LENINYKISNMRKREFRVLLIEIEEKVLLYKPYERGK
jgi:hypothetical protein